MKQIELSFDDPKETNGYGLGHMTVRLDRTVSTRDFNNSTMTLLAGADFLGFLVSMFGTRGPAEQEFMANECSAFRLKLSRVADDVVVADDKGAIGKINGKALMHATLGEMERLAKQLPPDPDNGGLDSVTYFAHLVRSQFP